MPILRMLYFDGMLMLSAFLTSPMESLFHCSYQGLSRVAMAVRERNAILWEGEAGLSSGINGMSMPNRGRRGSVCVRFRWRQETIQIID